MHLFNYCIRVLINYRLKARQMQKAKDKAFGNTLLKNSQVLTGLFILFYPY